MIPPKNQKQHQQQQPGLAKPLLPLIAWDPSWCVASDVFVLHMFQAHGTQTELRGLTEGVCLTNAGILHGVCMCSMAAL